jgi:hypothetical protein
MYHLFIGKIGFWNFLRIVAKTNFAKIPKLQPAGIKIETSDLRGRP